MATSERRARVTLWALRITWMVLPVVIAPVAEDLLRSRPDATRLTAESLLWVAWVAGLVSALAPRPLGLTVIRATSGSALGLSVLGAWNSTTVEVASASAVCALAVACATHARTAEVFANGAAYGDERRIPLRHPPLHRLILGPLGALLIALGIAGGPLLLTGGQWVSGTALMLVGWPVAALLFRSLHALSRRWLVLVPGGLVVHDPLVLASPVLLPNSWVRRARTAAKSPGGCLDLALRAGRDILVVELTEEVTFPIVSGNRRSVDVTTARCVAVAPHDIPGDSR